MSEEFYSNKCVDGTYDVVLNGVLININPNKMSASYYDKNTNKKGTANISPCEDEPPQYEWDESLSPLDFLKIKPRQT